MTSTVTADRPSSGARLLVWGLVSLFVVTLVRTAWVCDDAYISLRTVDNFVHGYGLRWNVDERVQAFTHPLWLFAISAFYAVTREAYFTVLGLSAAASLTAIWLYTRRIAAGTAMTVIGLLALTLSKSFMDYSTSGLENPLTHLLLALFFTCFFIDSRADTRRLTELSILAGLLALNRLDTVVLVAPALALRLVAGGTRAAVSALAVGFLPLVAWEVFSLIYYGLPFPNTAYAKLGGYTLESERAVQGLAYVRDAFSMDPLTPVVILLGLATPLARRSTTDWPVVLGVSLSVAYVISVGGDFMSGRMLSAAFFAALVVLTRQRWNGRVELAAVPVVLTVILGLSATDPALLTGRGFRHDNTDRDGIVDERRVYFPWTGFLNVIAGSSPLKHPWAHEAKQALARGERVTVWGANGFYGFVAGRRLHVIDKYALGDVLLARLPAEPGWTAGHLSRRIPEGYPESLATGHSVIAEPGVAALYERVRLITQGPIFTRHRFHAIWRLNTDGYESLLDGTSYGVREARPGDLRGCAADAIAPPTEPLRVHERGVLVRFDHRLKGAGLEISADGNDDFYVMYGLGNKTVAQRLVQRAWRGEPSSPHLRVLPPPSPTQAFDSVLVRPRRTWGPMNLWYVGCRQ